MTASLPDCAQPDLPEAAIQLVPTSDRAAVGMMLAGLDQQINVIVPRGGRSLVERVQKEARVPVIGHLEGLCHVYVDRDADRGDGARIVVNAKLRRTGICGAAETLLVDKRLRACGIARCCSLRWPMAAANCAAMPLTQAADKRVKAATEQDWRTEYLDAIIAVRVVDGVDEAIRHIATYGSAHTDSIVTGQCGDGREIPARSGQRHRAAQRLHAVRRWRRVRHGRGDRHFHRPLPCARAGGCGAADQLQVCGARHRAGPARLTLSRSVEADARARARRDHDPAHALRSARSSPSRNPPTRSVPSSRWARGASLHR